MRTFYYLVAREGKSRKGERKRIREEQRKNKERHIPGLRVKPSTKDIATSRRWGATQLKASAFD
jgi:hypothetical protein